MLLQLLVPKLRKIERRLEYTKLRSARARRRVGERSERAARQASTAIRSPVALALATVAGFVGGRIGSTSRRVRALEDQLATIERLVRQEPDTVAPRARSRGRGETRDGLDLQALLANVTRLATLVSLLTKAQTESDPDLPPAAPEDVAAVAGD